MKALTAFVRAYLMARRKKHGRGRAPVREAVFLARCAAYVASGARYRWLYPHWRYKPSFGGTETANERKESRCLELKL